METTCELCSVALAPTDSVILETRDVLVIYNKGIDSESDWLTVSPVRHVSHLTDLTQSERDIFCAVVAKIDDILFDEYKSIKNIVASPTDFVPAHIRVDCRPTSDSKISLKDFNNFFNFTYL